MDDTESHQSVLLLGNPHLAAKLRVERQRLVHLLAKAALGKTDLRHKYRLTQTPGSYPRYQTFLGRIKNVELLLLKGHLLIEEVLVELILVRCSNPDRFEALRPRLLFDNKLKLAASLLPLSDNVIMMSEKINDIRNKIAHRVEVSDFSRRIDEYVSLCFPDRSSHTNSQSRNLKAAIAFHLGHLSAFLEVTREMDWSPGFLRKGNV